MARNRSDSTLIRLVVGARVQAFPLPRERDRLCTDEVPRLLATVLCAHDGPARSHRTSGTRRRGPRRDITITGFARGASEDEEEDARFASYVCVCVHSRPVCGGGGGI